MSLTRPVRPARPSDALVAIGGVAGAAAREAVNQVLPTPAHGFPWSTLAVNVTGAFLLGMLIEAVARAGGEGGRLGRLRLLAGTGFMGAFTTYSTLAVEVDQLGSHRRVGLAVLYLTVSVVGGLAAAAAGIRLASGGLLPSGLPMDPDVQAMGPDE